MNNIDNAKRIVIKIGTSQLFDNRSGSINKIWFDSLISDISDYIKAGKEFIIVTSGAFASVSVEENQSLSKLKLADKQLFSVLGSLDLMKFYSDIFAKIGKKITPLYTTIEDIENRKRFSTAKTILQSIIEKGYIPIVSENDFIASAELRFGDCDRLSAKIAHISDADLLILFSHVDGLFSSDPTIDHNAHFIKTVYDISSDIEKMATDSSMGTGGMSAKVAAAKIALNSNTSCVIMKENIANPLKKLEIGFKSTWFVPNTQNGKKYIVE